MRRSFQIELNFVRKRMIAFMLGQTRVCPNIVNQNLPTLLYCSSLAYLNLYSDTTAS